jgi:sporulation protein YlmC with PRC-barrel domain
MTHRLLIPALLAVAGLMTAPAWAQVAGTTTVGITVTEATQLAMGWSAKKSLLDQTVYNEAGAKVGKIEDLIISPDRSVSYVIIGAGGFIGMGRHDVAIPVAQIQQIKGRMVMPGATQDLVKAMPEFVYASEVSRRDQLVASANLDLRKGEARLVQLRQKAGTVSIEAKAELDRQIASLQMDVKAVQAKLDEMKRAGTSEWREFESDLNAASLRLRRSAEAA